MGSLISNNCLYFVGDLDHDLDKEFLKEFLAWDMENFADNSS